MKMMLEIKFDDAAEEKDMITLPRWEYEALLRRVLVFEDLYADMQRLVDYVERGDAENAHVHEWKEKDDGDHVE